MSDLAPGTTIGPFRVLERLGAGASGAVYRVVDPVGRELALKSLRGRLEDARLERFAREGEVTAGLKHSGIVQVHATGATELGPYLVYELVEGEDLERAWRRLDRAQLLRALVEVGHAVGHAHAHGVVHRDLKPANVLLDRAGRARVTDFGMAQVQGLERLTRTGALVGTPHYMAPEQVGARREGVSSATDVWALGVMLYRALCGRLPFEGESLVELSARIATGTFPPLRSLARDVNPALEAVCARALSSDPGARYPDGEAFAADLERALAGGGVRRPRRRVGLVLAGLLALALVGWRVARREGGPAGAELPAPTAVDRARLPWETLDAACAQGEARAVRDAVQGLFDAGATPAELRAALVRHALQVSVDDPRPVVWLAELRELAPPAPEAEPELALARARFDALAQRFLRGLDEPEQRANNADVEQAGEACLAGLEALAAAGLRPRSPLSPRVAEGWLTLSRFGVLESRDYWRVVRFLVELDQPLHGEFFRIGAPHLERPWGGRPRDPWERYVEARIACRGGEPGERALELLRRVVEQEPGAEPRLGRLQRAQASFVLAGWRPEGREALIERALAWGPELPDAHGVRVARALDAKDYALTLERVEEALASFEREGYRGLTHTLGVLNDFEGSQVQALAELGQRERAREIYQILCVRGSGTARRLLASYPWLE
ncbi:MAG: protein kinase [Planctomycetota bacterium]